MFYTLLVITLLPMQNFANDMYFKIGNNHSALPFSRFSKLLYKDFHPVYEIGKSYTLNKSEKMEWFQTANIGYFRHKFVQTNLLFYSENGYSRKVTNSLYANAKLGLGYIHAFTAPDIIKQNADGTYEVKSDYGRPQVMFGLSLGFTYSLVKSVDNAPKLCVDYQTRMQTPYVKSYVPLLPYNVLKVGLLFPLHNKNL